MNGIMENPEKWGENKTNKQGNNVRENRRDIENEGKTITLQINVQNKAKKPTLLQPKLPKIDMIQAFSLD